MKMIRKQPVRVLMLLILLATMMISPGLCDGEWTQQITQEADGVQATRIELSQNSLLFLLDGERQQLTATVFPENAADRRVYWMATNESVATVDQNGYVTPRGYGITTVVAETANGIAAEVVITVTAHPATELALSLREHAMPAGTAVSLLAVIGPADAENRNITWSSSNLEVAVVNKNGKVFSKNAGECWISAQAQGGKDVIARCKLTVTQRTTPAKYIALTFDDGPCANTMDILDILSEYDVHATFFMLGSLVDAHPEYAQRVMEEGNELANHSYSHQTLTKIDLDEAKDELAKTDQAIYNATGYEVQVARAPGGSINADLAGKLNHIFVNWSVDTLDWKYRDPKHVYEYTIRNAQNYAVVLMHDIRPTTTESLHKMIPALLEQGYTLVTVSELIEIYGGMPEDTMIFKSW